MHNILLLEDLPEIRAWMKSLVMQVFPGALISEAARVHDALGLIGVVKFELALIDLGLPDGSGVDVVAALREGQPDTQSVVVTIHDDDEHLFPALQAGAFGYLLKEQARELIAEQLTRMRQGEPPLSPSIAPRAARAARGAHRPRERSAAACRQGLHAAGDRRATQFVAAHDRRLREADLPQAEREFAGRSGARGAAAGAVRQELTRRHRHAGGDNRPA